MATQRQIEANRMNAQKSTGPVTVEGKKASSLNALKSGLYAKTEVLPWESAADYGDLVDTMYSEHPVSSALARHYLDEVISCMWEVRRIRRSQVQLHAYSNDRECRPTEKFQDGKVIACYHKVLSTTQWRLDATRRALEAALAKLEKVQAADDARLAQPPDPADPEPATAPAPINTTPETDLPKIGFVPKPPSEPSLDPVLDTEPAALEPVTRLL